MRLHRRSIALAALLVLASLLAVARAEAARVALVVGISKYDHVPTLPNPGHDARDIGARLDALGYDVEVVLDADFTTLRRALRDFKDRSAQAEVAILYYAGHGIEVDRQNYLIPSDARLQTDTDVAFEAVPLDSALLAVDGARALRLVIVDACRNNPFAAQMQRSGATRSIGRGLGKIEPGGNTLVAYAAKEGTVAADGDGRNSPYALALLERLPQPGVEIGLLFRQVRDRVIELTNGRQEPFLYGSLSAEPFFFVPPAEAVQPAAEPPVTPPAPPGVSEAQLDLVFWQSVQESDRAADFQAYLDRFPNGIYASLARNRMAALAAPEPARLPETQVAALPPAPDAAEPPAMQPRDPQEIEGALGLGRHEWRDVQEALAAIGHDPRGIDGVPGPGTRKAIGLWQAANGHDPTGYLDAGQVSRLKTSAEPRLAAIRAERERQARLDPVSGRWTGSVRYTGDRAEPFGFEATLTKSGSRFTGRMSEPNTFAREPVSHLHAAISGSVGGDRSISFVKTYDGTGGQTHSVNYSGRLVRQGRIEGTWRTGGVTGTFVMTRQ